MDNVAIRVNVEVEQHCPLGSRTIARSCFQHGGTLPHALIARHLRDMLAKVEANSLLQVKHDKEFIEEAIPTPEPATP